MSKPLRADAQRNRETLIAAAREIFAAEGTQVPFEDVARRAGVGAGTLYRHFPNREALVAAVFRAEVSALRDRVAHLAATLPADRALATFLHEMVDHMYAQRGLGRTFLAVAERDSDAFTDDGAALERAVAALLRQGAEAGVLRADVSAGTVMLALHGISSASVRSERREESDGVVRLVVAGLRSV
ncbi:TetR/AcrR family transcriptional regulator [Cellulomonas cellasea]|uniref:AcrR family transcriptional regulator n=1 Tax=Cellulomonas cellasea TaxID=43670 RepID=A0A7W4UJD8_9CELL|nr:TetR/AcrR family transcriptional regulator [Cellulomonas cellasea]MBB2925258.1 AcrR family transcriptional regulator [Cellulomonas cellasea]